jgi:hypothetical protein
LGDPHKSLWSQSEPVRTGSEPVRTSFDQREDKWTLLPNYLHFHLRIVENHTDDFGAHFKPVQTGLNRFSQKIVQFSTRINEIRLSIFKSGLYVFFQGFCFCIFLGSMALLACIINL